MEATTWGINLAGRWQHIWYQVMWHCNLPTDFIDISCHCVFHWLYCLQFAKMMSWWVDVFQSSIFQNWDTYCRLELIGIILTVNTHPLKYVCKQYYKNWAYDCNTKGSTNTPADVQFIGHMCGLLCLPVVQIFSWMEWGSLLSFGNGGYLNNFGPVVWVVNKYLSFQPRVILNHSLPFRLT
jgi:hypothetical protein